jgi:hypothetical protein
MWRRREIGVVDVNPEPAASGMRREREYRTRMCRSGVSVVDCFLVCARREDTVAAGKVMRRTHVVLWSGVTGFPVQIGFAAGRRKEGANSLQRTLRKNVQVIRKLIRDS